eukprot:TRINITY_DN32774_c0_g1_i1.p1 TRINITY_DN32774_c0_g1~~TRINITY_DN32774_c0_g1_i1.p1  ORF type:complete len:447 (-),score=78.08 TRINITY_DN32774_c0_g1_i1:514-1854(-)
METADGPCDVGPLPEGWEAYFEEYYKQYYYHHHPTNFTTWERPAMPPDTANGPNPNVTYGRFPWEDDSKSQSATGPALVPAPTPRRRPNEASSSGLVTPHGPMTAMGHGPMMAHSHHMTGGPITKPSTVMVRREVQPSQESSSVWKFLACGPCCTSVDLQDAAGGDAPVYLDDDSSDAHSVAFKDVYAARDAALVEKPDTVIAGGGIYKGQWLGQQCHGKGILSRPDGSRYEGEFLEGRAHGHGKFVSKNGNVYEGQWKSDHAHGRGRYHSEEDGITYDGEWLQDQKSGDAVEKWRDGTVYEGQFLRDMKHGYGTYKSATGITYEGHFVEDKMEGKGTYTFADGRKYSGQMRRGHMDGHGVMEWPNGLRYEGTYEQDFRHGEGTLKWPDGRLYRGQWMGGKQHGRGVIVDTNGRETITQWKLGVEVTSTPSGGDKGTPDSAHRGGA